MGSEMCIRDRSTLSAGMFLLILIIALGDLVAQIPTAALVAVMIMVSVGTFNWRSIKPVTLRDNPRAETLVMVVTVLTTVFTHNLAYGVGVGVVLSAVLFARNVSEIVSVTSKLDPNNETEVYEVKGQLFFASIGDLVNQFDYDTEVGKVEIKLTEARIWDTSAVAALDAVVAKFAEREIEAELVGLNPHADDLHKRTSGKVGAH